MLYLLFLVQMVLLYVLSRTVNERLYLLSLLLTGSRIIAITIVTSLFFPGTVIHELSHLFVAEILGVHTGKLTLIPKEIENEYIRAGSVEVARTDPFRRTLIGLAPIFVGIVVITLLSIQLSKMTPTSLSAISNQLSADKNNSILAESGKPTAESYILFFFLGYLLLSITNNMFSSREDLYGVPPVLIFLGLLIGTCYVVGVRIQLTGEVLKMIEYIVKTINSNITIVLLINVGLFILLSIIINIVKRIRGVK